MTLRSLPVGMYHHVNANRGDFLTVSVTHFKRQMTFLHQEGYRTLSALDVEQFKRGGLKLPPKAIVLTFDDAWLDLYAFAYPILRSFGHSFIVFAVTDWVDGASKGLPSDGGQAFPCHEMSERMVEEGRFSEILCRWEHLQEMLESGLCSVESHTATHRTLRDLPLEEVREDVRRSRQRIKTCLGLESRQLCWPKGRYRSATRKAVKEEGIQITYLVRRGVNLPVFCKDRIHRFTVEDQDERWLERQIDIFSSPVAGYLYARLKPDRRKARLKRIFHRI